MTVQSTFTVDAAKAVPGGLADSGPTSVISRISAFAGIGFGIFVCRRATPADTPEQCGPPEVTGSVTARGFGFALRSHLAKQEAGYAIGESVPILTKGRLWVNCETAWTDGAAVFVRFTVEAPDLILGTVRNDADTDKAVALPGAKFVGTGSAAGLAMVEVNLPA
jgi:hypothetical protein